MGRLTMSCVAAGLVAAPLMVATPTAARDDVFMLNIQDALAQATAGGKLDGTVQFYFGDSAHPAVRRNLGEFVTNERTNGFGKSDLNSCNRVFESDLLKFQERAHALGANAVVDIQSYYRKEDVSSTTQIPCHAGFLMTAITLKGRFVVVAGR